MFVFAKAKREMETVRAEVTPEEMAAAQGGGGGYATYKLVCVDKEWTDAQGNVQTIQECYYEATDWDFG